MSPALVLGQLRAHLGRYLATFLAIAVAVGFLLSAIGIVKTLDASVSGSFGARYAHTAVAVSKVGDRTAATSEQGRRDAAAAEDRSLQVIRETPGVRAATVDSQAYVRMTPPGGAQRVTTATAVSADDELRWQPLAEGRFPTAPGEVAIRADGGLPLGTTFPVFPAGEGEGTTVTVVGLLDLANQPDVRSAFPIYAVDPQVQSWTSGGAGGEVRVAAQPGVDPKRLLGELRTRLAEVPGTETYGYSTGTAAADQLAQTFMGNKSVYTKVLYAFVVLAVAVAALVISTTFAVVFAARVREMALLRCLGAARWQIRLSALTESLVIGALATAAGLALGRYAVDVACANAGRLGVAIPLQQVTVPQSAYLIAGAVGLAVTLGAAVVPLLRATSGSPLAALRPTDVRPDPWWRRALVALLGLALALVCWQHLEATTAVRSVMRAGVWGVGTFVGVLLVVSALLPTVLGVLGTVVGLVLGPIGLLGARHTARNPRRTASVAAAVLIGVTLVTTMVAGIGLLKPAAQARFVDKIPLDISIMAPSGILPAGLADSIAHSPGVAASVVLTDYAITDDQGHSTVLRVADPAAIRAVLRRSVELPEPGQLVLPTSSSVATDARDGDKRGFTFFGKDDRRDLVVRRTAEQWALATPDSVPAWPVPELPGGRPWPEGVEVPKEYVPRTEMWVRMDDSLSGSELEAAAARVRATAFGAAPDLSVTEAFASRDQIERTVQAVLTSSVLLLAVTVVIAVVGVVNTLALSVAERARELTLLHRVGATRLGLWLMLVFETVLVAAAASAAGVALGIVLARKGATAVAGVAAGDGALPTTDVVGVGLCGVAAAVVAAAIASMGATSKRSLGA